NMLRTAQHNGWEAEWIPDAGGCRAVLRLQDALGPDGAPDSAIAARVTNRRLYDARPIPAEILAQLMQQTPALDGIQTHWIAQRERLVESAALIGRADAVMFGEGTMRRAFLSKVRFDAAATEPVAEGLS